jgi:hypothetical protein
MREQLDYLTLAMRRYPKAEPGMALMMFASDRRAAGLGALSKRHSRRGMVRCGKELNLLTYEVTYYRRIEIPAHDELPPFDFCLSIDSMPDCVTVTRVQERRSDLAVRCHRRDFEDQRGRNMVARMLRSMRRQAWAQEKVG